MTLAPGTIVGPYRVESLLGRGGMGEVYLATHENLGRKVALKLLAPELAADAVFRQRFIAESRLAASLDHPHIVPIYEAGEIDGRLFLAMRYVEGDDLGAIIARDGPLEPTRALGLLGGIVAALDAAHDRGLVHRDVKPGNILVARTSRGDEHAYLGDFGLVKQLGSDAGSPAAASSSARSTMSRPSRSRGARSITGSTFTPSPASSTRPSSVDRRTSARATRPPCGRTSRPIHPGCPTSGLILLASTR